MSMRTIGISMTDEEIKKVNELRTKNGSIRSVSQVLREIVIPVLMNGNNDDIRVSPPDVETKSQDANPFEGCLNILDKENDNGRKI